jgi:hypothetical protein
MPLRGVLYPMEAFYSLSRIVSNLPETKKEGGKNED